LRTGHISAESEMKKEKKKKEGKKLFLHVFSPQSEREKTVKKLPDSYMWFSLYSQT
jgi:hypothetical protein